MAVAVCLASLACRDTKPSMTPTVLLGPAVTADLSSGPEPFVLELDSTRAAITMMGLGAVQVQDVRASRVDTLGRRGGGPGEFDRAGRVVPWSGGRFAVVDPVEMRVTVYSAAGVFDTVIPSPTTVSLHDGVPSDDGQVWHASGAPLPDEDSLPLLRLAVSTNHVDTLTYLLAPRRTFTPLGDIALRLAPEYAARDVWGVAPDGRVWVARGADNRIDWIDRAGAITRGTPRPYVRIRTVDADRHRFGGLPAPPVLDTARRAMASIKAPFQDVVLASGNEFWVWCNREAGAPHDEYEVVRRDGTVRARVKVPPAHRVLAVGHELVYLLGEDREGDLVITTHVRPMLPP